LRCEIFGETAGDAEDEIRAGVIGAIELPDVLKGKFFERGDVADIVVAVGMVRVDDVVEMLLAEFLVVAFAE
jgi:hypothetical protein